MGDARRRAEKRKDAAKSVKPMTRHRFDLYAIGTRMAASRLVSEEVSYWSSHDEKLLGMVFFDTVDEDFMWMLLARDRVGRFRAVEVYGRYKSAQLATDMRWPRLLGQVGGEDKLVPGCDYAAIFRSAAAGACSGSSGPMSLYASFGVRPASDECGRRVL